MGLALLGGKIMKFISEGDDNNKMSITISYEVWIGNHSDTIKA